MPQTGSVVAGGQQAVWVMGVNATVLTATPSVGCPTDR